MDQSPTPTIYQEITANVKSGEYFKDALDWYSIRFIQPVTHRSFLALVTIVSVITSFCALLILWNILPMVEVVPLATENENMAEYYMDLQYIGKPEENPTQSIIKYLAGKYIQMREDYDFDKLKTDIDYIKTNSSEAEYNTYVARMKPDRPDSLVLRYRNHTKRLIEVKEVVVLPRTENLRLPPNQHRIAAYFVAREKGPAAEPDTTWKASLDVRFSDVVFYKDKEQFAPMDFLVTRYEVQQVDANQ